MEEEENKSKELPKPEEHPETPERKSPDAGERTQYFVIGAVVGIILSAFGSLFGVQYFADNVTTLAATMIVAAIFVSTIVYIAVRYRDPLLKRLFGTHRSTMKEMLDSVQAGYDDVREKRHMGAVGHVLDAVRTLAAWYTWVSFRRMAVQWVIAIFVAFGGVLGAVYLFKQNELIESQNKLIAKQGSLLENQNGLLEKENFLMESGRRSTLQAELSRIFDEVENEVEELAEEGGERVLPLQLVARIVAVSKSLKPYRYLDETGELIKAPVSPERAQLLLFLMELDLENFGSILQEADFRYADLPNSEFEEHSFKGLDFSFLNYNHSSIYATEFAHTKLNEADFSGSNLSQTRFFTCELERANFQGTTLNDSSLFIGSKMAGINFDRSRIDGVQFSGTEMSGASFRKADMHRKKLMVEFEWVTIRTQFSGAILQDADFSGADLRGVDFVYCDLQNSDFSGADLRGATWDPNTNLQGAVFDSSRIYLSQVPEFLAAGGDTSFKTGIILLREE